MNKKELLCYVGLMSILLNGFSQDTISTKKYLAYDGSEVKYTPQELSLKLPTDLKPILDYPMRDVSICLGPDSTYYMTGTTGAPDMWAVTSEIKIWKSRDLKIWTTIITKPRQRSSVWNVDREGVAWNKKISIRDGATFRPLWAPEIHYFNGTFWLTYSFPLLGNGILKSISGKAEGPYISALQKDEPLSIDIDASLFQDDDGKMYSVVGEGKITPMNNDLSAPNGTTVLVKPANAKHVGFEGAFLFKNNGIYYMAAAEFVNGDYHCFVASSNKIFGPYSNRYLAVPHGGHNLFFKDVKGNWYSTFFGNDNKAPFRDRPAILQMELNKDGHFQPVIK